SKPRNLDELQQRIIDECAAIPPEMIRSTTDNLYVRLAHCQTVNGEYFEHLL
ncbi:hypothetical protein EAI_05280, partial [Harpegnathos saltator]